MGTGHQCYLFHDQHRASCALCQKAPAGVPWTQPSSHGKRKPGRPSTSYITYIQRLLGYQEVEISADEIATLAEDRCAWRNLAIACFPAEG